MKLILCPTDFSSNAGTAVTYAAALADRLDAYLMLVHAYEVPAMFTDAPMTSIRDAVAQLKVLSDSRLQKVSRKLKKEFPSLRFEAVSLEGVPYQMILSFASEKNVDLIVMGATGTGKLTRVLMGSTTAKVIRDSSCAVLTIPKDARFSSYKRMVYATDLQEDNIRAASMLVPFASLFDAEICCVFVDDRHLLHDDETILKMTKRIRSRVKYSKLSGYIAKDTSISKGLERFLKKTPAELLVMFTHERHFPETLFSQSVTRLVAHQTNLPLLSIKFTDRPVA